MTKIELAKVKQQNERSLLAIRLLWSQTDEGKYMDITETQHIRKVMAELTNDQNHN